MDCLLEYQIQMEKGLRMLHVRQSVQQEDSALDLAYQVGAGLDRGKYSIEAQYETDWVASVEDDAPTAER